MNFSLNKQFILDAVRAGRLTKAQGFDLLEELTGSELARVGPSYPVHVPSEPAALRNAQSHPDVAGGDHRVAVVGYSCRLPGAEGPDQFWHNLAHGVDLAGAFPEARIWDSIRTRRTLFERFAATAEGEGDEPVMRGSFLRRIDTFDPAFFGLSRSEARTMGPADRLYLQVAWEALESAGCTQELLRGSRTSVFTAHSPSSPYEYAQLLPETDPQRYMLNSPGAIGYRLSYWLDLVGSTEVIDTTCSSSLTAVHRACAALRAGECDRAVVGGLSIITLPYLHETVTNERVGLLSSDGRSRSFGGDADGLAVGEGVVAVVLRRAGDAVAEREPVRSFVLGSAMGCDGRTNSPMAPSPIAQTRMMREAWQRAGIDGRQLSYVEAHGAGTKLGDPVEVTALCDALRADSDDNGFCGIGAVKSNVGHLGDGAGITSMLKMLLAIEHEELPPSLHLEVPNPLLPDLEASPVRLVDALEPWSGERYAGITSLGLGGTNCHVVLGSPPSAEPSGDAPGESTLVVSARTIGALWRYLDRYASFLASTKSSLVDICETAELRRDVYSFRAAICASTVEELRGKVTRLYRARQFEGEGDKVAEEGAFAGYVVDGIATAITHLPGESDSALARSFFGQVHATDSRAPRRTVALPTYPFEEERIWPEHEVPDSSAFDDLLYDTRWVASEATSKEEAFRPGHWLVLGEDVSARELADAWRREGAEVTLVSGIDTTSPASFEAVVDSMPQADFDALVGVVHAWGLDDGPIVDDDARMMKAQDEGCLALFRIIKALLRRDAGALQTLQKLLVVGRNAHAVAEDTTSAPDRVTAFGAARVLSQEYPHIDARGIDVDAHAGAATILRELRTPRAHADELVAFRGGTRYVQEVVRLDATAATSFELRDGGTYVLAGGTGFLGRHLARHFAEIASAAGQSIHLVLMGRTPGPHVDQWAAIRKSELSTPRNRQLATLGLELAALGASVSYEACDVTDSRRTRRALSRIRKATGSIDGVVMGVKELYHQPIAELGDEEFRRGVMNRVQGMATLDFATRDDDLQFFIALSSVSSLLGTKAAIECCAVNQFLDSYVHYGRSAGQPITVLNLGLILGEDRVHFRGGTPIPPLSVEEFLAGFDRAMSVGAPFSLLVRFDATEVMRLLPVLRIQFAEEIRAEFERAAATDTVPSVAKESATGVGSVRTDRDVVEVALSRLWEEVLGSPPRGPAESFFDAGGTSLTVLNLVNGIRERWGTTIEAADIFESASFESLIERIASGDGVAEREVPTSLDDLDMILDRVAEGGLSIDAAIESFGGGDL